MKKFVKLFSLSLVVISMFTCIPNATIAKKKQVKPIVVNPAKQSQPFEGWGTTLCWWAEIMGGWPEQEKEKIADLIFTKKGLNLNIVRFNIGGGENPNCDFGKHMREGAAVPGFQPSEGVWNWNADPNQTWFLKAAKKRGANIFEAFANSAPYWMTNSKCTSGQVDGSSNLPTERFPDFANYLTEVIKHYRDNEGIVFDTVSPMNEPSSDWWTAGCLQEGCHFDAKDFNKLIIEVGKSLEKKGLNKTKVSASDENSIDFETGNLEFVYSKNALKYIGQINVHAYEGNSRSYLRSLAKSKKKKLYMSEYGCGVGIFDKNSMDSALQLSDTIIKDINEMKPSAWINWQIFEQSGGSSWNLAQADYDSHTYVLAKSFYAMANFSKYIRPGYRFITTNNANSVVAYGKKDKKLVIIVRNNSSSSKKLKYDFSKFKKVGLNAAIYRTSNTENTKKLSKIKINKKQLSVNVKPKSITTYVISNVKK